MRIKSSWLNAWSQLITKCVADKSIGASKNPAENPDFSKFIIFSDEAHFQLDGYVFKQNCRYSSDESPMELQPATQYAEKVTVWCGFWCGGVIGPYFFENDAGQSVTVNGEHYRSMLENFFWPEIAGLDLKNIWFQQDGAAYHTADVTMNLLKTKFGNQIISWNGPVNWPAWSCDLTPCDFFLWGFLKDRV